MNHVYEGRLQLRLRPHNVGLAILGTTDINHLVVMMATIAKDKAGMLALKPMIHNLVIIKGVYFYPTNHL